MSPTSFLMHVIRNLSFLSWYLRSFGFLWTVGEFSALCRVFLFFCCLWILVWSSCWCLSPGPSPFSHILSFFVESFELFFFFLLTCSSLCHAVVVMCCCSSSLTAFCFAAATDVLSCDVSVVSSFLFSCVRCRCRMRVCEHALKFTTSSCKFVGSFR